MESILNKNSKFNINYTYIDKMSFEINYKKY